MHKNTAALKTAQGALREAGRQLIEAGNAFAKAGDIHTADAVRADGRSLVHRADRMQPSA